MNGLILDNQAKTEEIDRLRALAIRAWHSFRSTLAFPECENGLRNEDIEALVKLAETAEAGGER